MTGNSENRVRDPQSSYKDLVLSEQRLQGALQIATVGMAFFANSGRITEANDAYLRMMGHTHSDLFSGSLSWGDGTAREWLDLLKRIRIEYDQTGQVKSHERQCQRTDGTSWWGLFVAQRLTDHEGLEYVVDITQRIEAERELRDNQRRLRVLLEGIPQVVWSAAADGSWTWASPQWTELTGQPELHSRGLGWLDMVHPLDRDQALRSWQSISWSEVFEADYRLWHVRENRFRSFKSRALPVRDDRGTISEWLGTSTDIEDLRQRHAQERVLTGELQHRTRNLLALVRSIARQTLGGTELRSESLADFENRLAALGRVQKLVNGNVASASLRELVEAELSAVTDAAPQTAHISGPDVELQPNQVQTLALALHELATNAFKYGALAAQAGRLAVTWRIVERKRLELDWVESDVPMPAEVPTHRGFGRQLIEEALPFTLNARTEFEFRADGVRFRIELAL